MNESTVAHSGIAASVMADGSHDFAAPIDGATYGRLEITHGVSRAAIRGEAGMAELCRARFEGPLPTVEARQGKVTIRYPRFAPMDWIRVELMKDRPAADVALNTTVPWTVAFDGGITKSTIDLSELRVSAVELAGGASEIALTLPAPDGVVPIRIGGGVSKLTIHRPSGIPVRLQIKGGASHLALDDQRFGAIGGKTRLASGDDANTAGRYDITIDGGASKVTID